MFVPPPPHSKNPGYPLPSSFRLPSRLSPTRQFGMILVIPDASIWNDSGYPGASIWNDSGDYEHIIQQICKYIYRYYILFVQNRVVSRCVPNQIIGFDKTIQDWDLINQYQSNLILPRWTSKWSKIMLLFLFTVYLAFVRCFALAIVLAFVLL